MTDDNVIPIGTGEAGDEAEVGRIILDMVEQARKRRDATIRAAHAEFREMIISALKAGGPRGWVTRVTERSGLTRGRIYQIKNGQ